MNDIFDNPIEVGDEVIYSRYGNNGELSMGIVDHITDKSFIVFEKETKSHPRVVPKEYAKYYILNLTAIHNAYEI